MSQINPFIASALQAPNVQRQQAEDRDAAAARDTKRRRASATGDSVELTVDGADTVEAVGDRDPKRRPPRHDSPDKQTSENEKEPAGTHIDLVG